MTNTEKKHFTDLCELYANTIGSNEPFVKIPRELCLNIVDMIIKYTKDNDNEKEDDCK